MRKSCYWVNTVRLALPNTDLPPPLLPASKMSSRGSEHYITLNDGHQMPLLGLGTWQPPKGSRPTPADQRNTALAVLAALTAGYRHIDTAFKYLNEEAVGEGIRAWIKNTGGKRSDLFIVNKLPFVAMHPNRVERFLKMSLKNMALDYVDLYLLHMPVGLKYLSDDDMYPMTSEGNMLLDYGTDHIAIWRKMTSMKEKGLTKSIGVSNFNIKQLRRLMAQPMIPPAVNQVELHAEFQQPGLRRYCTEEGVALTGYGNLGSPGRRGTPAEVDTKIPSLFDNPIIQLVAENHTVEPAQVLLKYWVQQGIAVVPMSVTPSTIISNSKIFGWSLSDVEMQAISTLDKGEEGRTFRFLKLRGMNTHPECPVPPEG